MPIEILDLVNSAKPTKRFKITIKEGDEVKSFDFGYKSGTTYIDHADENKGRLTGRGIVVTERSVISSIISYHRLRYFQHGFCGESLRRYSKIW